MELPAKTAALKKLLDAMPGAVGAPMNASRGSQPLVMIYKIMGKTFAILGLREEPFVMLKCDPERVDILREAFAGIGHRTHLDPRYWICVELDADVPAEEVKELVAHSWDQVAATLTKKRRLELAALRV